MSEPHEHDFRRIYPSDIYHQGESPVAPPPPRRGPGEAVVAVCCCVCGLSPLATGGRHGKIGDWPSTTHRITSYAQDDERGPSVEFEVFDGP